MNNKPDTTTTQLILNQNLLPACIIDGTQIIMANDVFLTKLGNASLPLAFADVLSVQDTTSLRAEQNNLLDGKKTESILRLVFKPPRQLDWHCLGGLRRVDETSERILITWQDDVGSDAHYILQVHLQEIDEFILIADFEHQRVMYANHPDFLGYSWQEMVDSQWLLDHIHPEDQIRVKIFREQTNYTHGPNNTIVYRLKVASPHTVHDANPSKANGSVVPQDSEHYEWVESRETCLASDDAGNCLRTYMRLTVVTQRKEFEQLLFERNRALIAIEEITKTINQNLDINLTMTELFAQIKEIIPFVSASIFVIERSNTVALFAHTNLPDDVVDILSDHVLVDNLTQHVIKNVKPRIVSDTYLEPEWYMLDNVNYIRSWMGVPLTHEDKIIGVMNFDHDEVGFYNQTHYDYAISIASHIALAMHKHHMIEQLQVELSERQQAEEVLLEALARTEAMYQSGYLMMQSTDMTRILPEILNLLMLAISADTMFLISFDLSSGEPKYVQSFPKLPQESIWQDFEEIVGITGNKLVHMPGEDLDFAGRNILQLSDGRHGVASTLHRRGVLVAIREQAPFDVYDVDLLITLSSMLSVTIERDELTMQLQGYTNRLELMVTKATSSLQLERQRLQAILDATGEGIVYMEDYVIQYANVAFCRMLGYSADELQGTILNELRQSRAKPLPSMFDIDDTQPVNRAETTLIRKDGSVFQATLTFSLIGTPDKQAVSQVVAVVRDTSYEQGLHEQRMRFISNAAHELRTPLTSLHLRLHMARRQPEKISEHLDSLDSVYEYLKILVEELLDLSRFEKGTVQLEYATVDLCSLGDAAIEWAQDHAKQANVSLVHEFECPLRAHVDVARMTQVFQILLTNGINYSEAGGDVYLSLKTLTYHNKSLAEIVVGDTGIGIAPDLLPDQIFAPFARARLGSRRETGMGLAIAREIIKLHGGHIEASRNKNKGSIFRIILPLTPEFGTHNPNL